MAFKNCRVPIENDSYYWCVIAYDSLDNSTCSSDTFKFVIGRSVSYFDNSIQLFYNDIYFKNQNMVPYSPSANFEGYMQYNIVWHSIRGDPLLTDSIGSNKFHYDLKLSILNNKFKSLGLGFGFQPYYLLNKNLSIHSNFEFFLRPLGVGGSPGINVLFKSQIGLSAKINSNISIITALVPIYYFPYYDNASKIKHYGGTGITIAGRIVPVNLFHALRRYINLNLYSVDLSFIALYNNPFKMKELRVGFSFPVDAFYYTKLIREKD